MSVNTKTELTAIIARNDKLIQELEKLHLLNEKEMNLYRLIENSPSFSFQKVPLKTDAFKETIKVNPAEEAVKKLQNEAAIKIQNAYRKYLFRQRCHRRVQKWNVVKAKKSIELINKISKTVNKRPVPVKFDLKLWKNEYNNFNDARKKRATAFEKRNALFEQIKAEQDFLNNEDVEEPHNLPKLKPYQFQQAEKELSRRLGLAEDEAFISAL